MDRWVVVSDDNPFRTAAHGRGTNKGRGLVGPRTAGHWLAKSRGGGSTWASVPVTTVWRSAPGRTSSRRDSVHWAGVWPTPVRDTARPWRPSSEQGRRGVAGAVAKGPIRTSCSLALSCFRSNNSSRRTGTKSLRSTRVSYFTLPGRGRPGRVGR